MSGSRRRCRDALPDPSRRGRWRRSAASSPGNGVTDGPRPTASVPGRVTSSARPGRPARTTSATRWPTPDEAPRRSPGCRRRPGPRCSNARPPRQPRRAGTSSPGCSRSSSASRSRTAGARSTGSPTRSRSAPPRPASIGGEVLPVAGWRRGVGNTALTYRAPVGVALAITPFNAPANLLAHKLGAAFAAGNTTIVKPPPQAPARLGRRGRAAARGRHAGRGGPGAARRRRASGAALCAAARGRRDQLHRQRGHRARRWPARPAPSGSCWSSAATPRRSCARTPTSPRPPGSAPRTGYSNSGPELHLGPARLRPPRALRRVRRRASPREVGEARGRRSARPGDRRRVDGGRRGGRAGGVLGRRGGGGRRDHHDRRPPRRRDRGPDGRGVAARRRPADRATRCSARWSASCPTTTSTT